MNFNPLLNIFISLYPQSKINSGPHYTVKCSYISPQLLDKLKKSERERQHVYFRRKKEDARETMEGEDLVTINVTDVEVGGEKTSPLTN